MRDVLVTSHGADRKAVDAARRRMPYRKLVVLTSRPGAPDLPPLRRQERLANVEVEILPVDARDFLRCLAVARRVLDAHARDRVKVHVAGGPNLLASALLLAAFEKGVEAFFCHERGVSRLPVAVTVEVTERFTDAERRVLAALPPKGRAALGEIDAGVAPATVKETLLRLRKKGLVTADHVEASLTPVGAYYREHFRAST